MWKEEVQQLISLMQLHLFQEYEPLQKIPVTQESYEFFKTFARNNQKQQLKKTYPKQELTQQQIRPTNKQKIADTNINTGEKSSNDRQQLQERTNLQEVKKSPKIVVEKQKNCLASEFSIFFALMKKFFPNKQLLDAPSETQKDIKQQPQIALFVEQTLTKPHQTFINRLQQAIEQRLSPIKIIHHEEHFSCDTTIKIFIASKNISPTIFKHFPNSTFIHLEPIDNYLQNPDLKRRLWKQILNAFENILKPD